MKSALSVPRSSLNSFFHFQTKRPCRTFERPAESCGQRDYSTRHANRILQPACLEEGDIPLSEA